MICYSKISYKILHVFAQRHENGIEILTPIGKEAMVCDCSPSSYTLRYKNVSSVYVFLFSDLRKSITYAKVLLRFRLSNALYKNLEQIFPKSIGLFFFRHGVFL